MSQNHSLSPKMCGLLSFEKITGVLLCNRCETGFATERSASIHLEKEHNIESATSKSVARQIMGASRTNSKHKHPLSPMYWSTVPDGAQNRHSLSSPLPALPGLAVVDGLKCPTCNHCTKSMRSLRAHVSEKHEKQKVDFGIVEQKGRMKMQTLLGGKKTAFFPVTIEKSGPFSGGIALPSLTTSSVTQKLGSGQIETSSGVKEKTVIGAMRSLLSESHGENDVSIKTVERDRNSVNDFIEKTQFDHILRDECLSLEDAVGVTTLGNSRDLIESTIRKDVGLYLLRVTALKRNIPPCILAKIALHQDNEFSTISEKSAQRYARNVSKVMIAARRLRKSNRVDVGIVDALEAYELLLEPGTYCDSPTVKEKRLARLHIVMMLLLMRVQKIYEHPSSLFIRLFIACCAVSVDYSRDGSAVYRFVEASELSPMLAAIQYATCCTAISEVWDVSMRAIDDKNLQVRTSGDLDERVAYVLACLDVEKNTVASYVRAVLNTCMTQLRMKTVGMSFVECKQHRCCGFVNGEELSLRDEGKLISGWQDELEQTMLDKLLLGFTLPDGFECQLHCLKDVLSEKKKGFSFFTHPANRDWLNACSTAFIEYLKSRVSEVSDLVVQKETTMLSAEELQKKGDIISVGDMSLYQGGVNRWLRACVDVQEALLSCIHLSSGSPARDTEIATFKLRNTAYTQRNVYLSQGDVVLIARYSKMRNRNGGDRPIARFPDQRTSRLLLTYLIMVRPLEAVLVEALHGNQSGAEHWETLFVERGRPYEAGKIREVLKDRFEREGLSIGFSHIRDHSAAMVRLIGKEGCKEAEALWEEFQNVGHLQAGHSVRTADDNYGRSDRDFVGLGATELGRYRSWALRLQHEMGLRTLSGIAAPSLNADELRYSDIDAKTQTLPILTESSMENLSDQVASKLLESLTATGKRTRDTLRVEMGTRGSAENPQKRCRTEIGYFDMVLRPAPRHVDADVRKYLPALRKALRNEDASFKSQLQADVVAAVHEGKDDLLVVMPTGAGKSLCFMLPVIMEKQNKCTVVIVPLVALRDEILLKCRHLGIETATWEDRKRPGVQMYIFSAEYAQMNDFHCLLRNLMASRRLARIVVDEVHFISLWKDFRPVLSELQFILRTVKLPVPRVLLSATVPVEERIPVLRALGLRSAVLYHCSTARSNLRFKVVKITKKLFETPEESMYQALEELLKTSIFALSPSDRVMVYFQRKKDIASVQERLSRTTGWGTSGSSVLLLTYHAGLSDKERRSTHQAWTRSDALFRVMLCSAAFGCGVDSSNVRAVIHFGGSSSLIEYAQEAGRAGRDGKEADCVVLFCPLFAQK